MNVVITGASRGIGLELTKQALERGDRVMAIARTAEESPPLKSLKAKFKNQLEMKNLDLAHSHAPGQIADALAPWPHIDTLLNNAGIYRRGVTEEDFIESFRVNSIAPFLVTRALFKKLKASSSPKAIQTSSLMGSIGDNTSGRSYAYRASKAALNMITKNLAEEEKWLIAVVVHPGWVKTDMGGDEAPILPETSAEGLWHIIQNLTAKDTGGFYDFEGSRLPW